MWYVGESGEIIPGGNITKIVQGTENGGKGFKRMDVSLCCVWARNVDGFYFNT